MMRKENPHSGFHIPGVMRLRWKDHEFKAALGYIADRKPAYATSQEDPPSKQEEKRKLHTLLVL